MFSPRLPFTNSSISLQNPVMFSPPSFVIAPASSHSVAALVATYTCIFFVHACRPPAQEIPRRALGHRHSYIAGQLAKRSAPSLVASTSAFLRCSRLLPTYLALAWGYSNAYSSALSKNAQPALWHGNATAIQARQQRSGVGRYRRPVSTGAGRTVLPRTVTCKCFSGLPHELQLFLLVGL